MKLLKPSSRGRSLVVALILLLSFPSVSRGQRANSLNTANQNATILVNMGCEGTSCAGLTIDATSGGVVLTASIYNPTVANQPAGFSQAQRADCYNVGAKIWVTDNSAATLATGKGRAILDGGYFTIYGYDSISKFHAIRDAAVSSLLYCDYYRQD